AMAAIAVEMIIFVPNDTEMQSLPRTIPQTCGNEIIDVVRALTADANAPDRVDKSVLPNKLHPGDTAILIKKVAADRNPAIAAMNGTRRTLSAEGIHLHPGARRSHLQPINHHRRPPVRPAQLGPGGHPPGHVARVSVIVHPSSRIPARQVIVTDQVGLITGIGFN